MEEVYSAPTAEVLRLLRGGVVTASNGIELPDHEW